MNGLCYLISLYSHAINKVNSSINKLDRINLQPFFNLQIFNMKLFANNRQKLSLNRIRKASTPQKLQIESLNGCKVTTLHNALSNKDTNLIKMGNSSIFRKTSESEADKRQKMQCELIRCRSISCLDPNIGKSNTKMIPSLQKLTPSTVEDKACSKRPIQQIIHQSYKSMMLVFKQRGFLIPKHNCYSIHVQTFNDMFTQIGQKIIQTLGKIDPQTNSDASTSKDTSQSQLPQKNEKNLKVYNQFSIHDTLQKVRKLSYQFKNINLHFQYEHRTAQKDFFWKIMENIETERLSEHNFNFLLDKNKYLKQEILNREAQLKRINQTIEQTNSLMEEKRTAMSKLQKIVEEKQNYLEQVDKIVKEIEGFVNKQPNKILQQQAEGYKQRQQQLFDLAFMFEQSAPSSIIAFIEEAIMIPFQSFKLTLGSFKEALNEQDYYEISVKDMQSFKNSLNSAYESTIEKLKAIIERKATKIRNFVGILRRLASYTIGKRQYLTQINKKMAIVSTKTQKKIALIQKYIRDLAHSDDKMMDLAELLQLISTMKNIYCEAEVFY